jgi:mannose-6-phosphate isomerase-like protein (cupin superfamily)
MNPDVFPEPLDLGERIWGEEVLLAVVSGKYSLKRLLVRAGCKGGLQYHRLKDEVAVVISGQMIIRTDDGSGNLVERIVGPGDVVHFSPGVVHQEEAITDCVLIEASTPHFNDRVRLEEIYLSSDITGLPTTAIDDIVEL